MNLFVANPHWGWWIILYFFLGGISAGAYFVSTLIDLVGTNDDGRLARVGYSIAFPLIAICGLFLIVDLNYPSRFWHMLLAFKYWSPMSVGSWAISLFGLCSFISFVASMWPQSVFARWHASRKFGIGLRVVGCGVGFFVASYTGALLTATNQPIWSDTVWIAPLFLTSAASTGIATMILLGRKQSTADSLARLERADLWVVLLELVVFALFLLSLGSFLPPLLRSTSGGLLVVGTLAFALLIPLTIHVCFRQRADKPLVTMAICVLIGGFVLRWGILTTPSELLANPPPISANNQLSGQSDPPGIAANK